MATNPFRDSWLLARQQGVKKDVWAQALGVSRNRADELTAGRSKATVGEISALTSRQRAWLIRYRDVQDGHHAFYTGRNKTLDEVVASGALGGIAAAQAMDFHYAEPQEVVSIQARWPRHPDKVRIYPTRQVGRHRWTRDDGDDE